MKKNYLLYSFFVIIIIFTAISIGSEDKKFSEFENRNLKTKVDFTFKSFMDGSFQKNYEKYINDQFFLRDQWISLKSKGEYLLGKIENNGIIYGDNGQLFEKFDSFDTERLENNLKAIEFFAKNNPNKVSLMIVPNSYEIYKENLPLGAPQVEQEKIIKEIYSFEKFTNNIDIMSQLIKNKDQYIYYKTDHHWTTYGAYLGYCQFVESIGLKPIDINRISPIELDNFYGAYFSKSKPFNISGDVLTYYEFSNINMEIVGDKVYNSLYDYSKTNLRDKYAMFLYGNNPLTIIRNKEISNGKKLLVIKDSFANSIVPFLTQNYEEIHVVDFRSFTTKISTYTEENQFDNILILYNFINLAKDNSIIRLTY